MSNRKSKQTKNNENQCPFTSRKRIKSSEKTTKATHCTAWKWPKLETSSALPTYLQEMGIGMLDSEESSSSAASAVALVSTAGTDENSNEATPNLDAPKFRHESISYRALDNTLDISTDNANNSSDILTDDLQQQLQQKQRNNIDKPTVTTITHPKKVAILGAGAGITKASTITSNAHNSNSNSPSASRSTRSPLSTVTLNSYHKNSSINAQRHQQQNLISSTSPTTNGNVTTLHAATGGTTSQNYHGANSPSQPSTSHQAALIKHQQQLLEQQQARFVPNENFFLFRPKTMQDYCSDGQDNFNKLSDEILLQIFKWLPKKTLIRCSLVSHRFNRCASDETLWARLDLGGRALRAGALENILTRGVVILRLAQAELCHPVFHLEFLQLEQSFESKLQYLDLSMVSVAKPSLKVLLSRCRLLKKLSLEHVPINDEICNEIGKNTNLEALNLAMCIGLEAWSVRKIMESLKSLSSLNISWTNLSVDAVTSLVTNVTPSLMRLNIAGCRKTMFDSHLSSLAKRCSQLLELDLSDCTGLTGNAITILCKFKMLEYLSLSRCYLIPVSSYMELKKLSSLSYLDVFGMLSDTAMETLERNFPDLGINKFIHSSVARPTVGTRRTSIWGLRTRD